MAKDAKYGMITAERGDIVHGKPGIPFNDSGDEPVFVIRGQDVCAFQAVLAYRDIAFQKGASEELVSAVNDVAEGIQIWQTEHSDLVKIPD
jgi:hypothetical protein